MKITKRQLKRIIKEYGNSPPTPLHEPGEEPLDWSNRNGSYDDPAYDADYDDADVSRDPEVQKMLIDGGFNADGSFGADGYPGPTNWQLYAPKTIEEAERWINAAIDMNFALKEAEAALDQGEYQSAQDAFFEIVYPVQSEYGKTGAADTEGREVAGDWLEKQGYEW